ncbi:MHYT domain-containing protein [Xanthobacter sp. V3C-3]|uniref:MHYT domain-containing protein n=1 Tax=Xanthobacter lutulentifluminis TaxID=3119935 RepID=UPI0037262CF6
MTPDGDPGPTPLPRAGGHRSAGDRGPRPQVLLALFAVGLAAFNFPLLIVWDAPVTVLGLPLLPVALFAIWAALIAALALASERRSGRDVLPPAPGDPGHAP